MQSTNFKSTLLPAGACRSFPRQLAFGIPDDDHGMESVKMMKHGRHVRFQ
jgi:hypothetical protein